MSNFIQVGYKKEFLDPLADSLIKKVKKNLGINMECRVLYVYIFEKELKNETLEKLAKELFCDKINQEYKINQSFENLIDFDNSLLIGYKKGVTDNTANTSSNAVYDLLNIETKISYKKLYLIKGIDEQELKKIKKMIYNPLIEYLEVMTKKETLEKKYEYENVILEKKEKIFEEIELVEKSDEWLIEKNKKSIWSLNLNELKIIRDYFLNEEKNRIEVGLTKNPTDVEMEVLAQTWSEHCKHKIFNAKIDYYENGVKNQIDSLFKTYIVNPTKEILKEKDFLVSIFKDNGGIIKADEETNVAIKVETHNAPSALDPYGGALTGILGVNRDILGTGLGAEPLFNTDVFCVGNLDVEQKKAIMHPKVILEGIRKGVEDGANTVGIPCINGSTYFDNSFIYRPLVFCGTCGIMPSQIDGKNTHEKIIKPGYLAVMVGGKIGADGIHGATFSSEKLDETSPTTAVQIGDPITQKKMSDFLILARDLKLYEAITDNGAGGLSSSIGELAQISNGCNIYLDRCPLKYPGLMPWEILVSESQERMTIAVKQENFKKLKEIAQKRDVLISIVGIFTDSNYFIAGYKGKILAYINMDFLHNKNPKLQLKAEYNLKEEMEPDLTSIDIKKTIFKILKSENITSKKIITSQYDHEVKAKTILKLMCGDGPQNAGAIRIYNDKDIGLGVSNGLCPRYSKWDCYDMACCAVEEALRNLVSIGCPLSKVVLLDNFCWTDPIESENNKEGAQKLGDLVRANMAIKDMALLYKTPFVSGKDSMKNDYYLDGVKISILPTLLITALGVIPDIKKLNTMDIKKEGDLIYILGQTKDEFGGSEFLNLLSRDSPDISCPKVDLNNSFKILNFISNSYSFFNSCHDISQGGFVVALIESLIAGEFGAKIDLDKMPYFSKYGILAKLFSETQSRFIVSIDKEKKLEFEAKLRYANILFGKIGEVTKEQLIIKENELVVFSSNISDLKEAFKTGLDI